VTVAIALQTAEGVVLGSDSTTTVTVSGRSGTQVGQLFNSAQKIFEIGPTVEHFVAGQTFSGGVAVWGAGSFGPVSWRSFVSEFYCRIIATSPDFSNTPRLLLDFAQKKWAELQQLGMVKHSDPIPDAAFAIATIHKDTHEVQGATVNIRAATVSPLPRGDVLIGGDPATVLRIVNGYDPRLVPELQKAGIDVNAFTQCAKPFSLSPYLNHIPLRDAIDFVHFLIYAAIKLHRYKGGPAMVGGPIEIAAITADRGFRWVLHKPLHESIGIPRGEYLP